MTVSVPSLPTSWVPDSATDATSAQLVRDVEAPLLQLTPHTQQAAPGIARSWKYDASRTRLTVTLRPKAAFSDGQHVTPQDVVFSVHQWLKGPVQGALYSHLISGVATHGKDAVVFTLTAPSSAMVDTLTLSSSAIVPDGFGGDTRRRLLRPSCRRGSVRDRFHEQRHGRPQAQQALLRPGPPLPRGHRLPRRQRPGDGAARGQQRQDRPRGGSAGQRPHGRARTMRGW